MMVGEGAVDLGEQQVMLARQQLDQLLDHRAGRAVAGVPADPIGAAGIARDQPADIIVLDVEVGDGALALFPVAFLGQLAELLDVGAERTADAAAPS